MTAERIDGVLRARERSWAWLARRIGTNGHRIWRLRRAEVPWRQHEALAVCEALQMPFGALFGNGEEVLPQGRERRTAVARHLLVPHTAQRQAAAS